MKNTVIPKARMIPTLNWTSCRLLKWFIYFLNMLLVGFHIFYLLFEYFYLIKKIINLVHLDCLEDFGKIR